MSTRVQNGTTIAHGHEWPLYERPTFAVDVTGYIDAADLPDAEILAAALRAVLDRYGVKVRVYPVMVHFMSPEDKAEKNELDEQAEHRSLTASDLAVALENH